MPTIALASHYWPGDDQDNYPDTSVPMGGIYPYWFDPSTVGMGLGFLAGFHLPNPRRRFWWETYWKRTKGWMVKKRRKLHTKWFAAYYALKLVFGKDFDTAAKAVFDVTRDPSSRNLKAWNDVARTTAQSPSTGENVWRALMAHHNLKTAAPHLPKQDVEVLVELAYLGYKKRHGN